MKLFKNTYLVKKISTVAVLFSLLVGFAGTVSAAEVAYRGQGSWNYATGTSPAYWADKGVWIDATVENLGYTKEVSVLWTDDDWTTSQYANLTYDYSLPNNYEVWGVDFAPMGRLGSYYIGSWHNYITNHTRAGGTSVTIKYAIRYKVNGNTYWDSNNGNNYSLLINL